LIFFVDYNAQYPDFNYLEAAPTDGVFASSAATGVWAATLAACGTSSNANCQLNTIYTQTGVALATIRGEHRGLFGGQAATNAIIAKHGDVNVTPLNSYAAGVADTYSSATKNDYYLPTRDEVNLMLNNLAGVGVGGFVDLPYWSSSESSTSAAWRVDFGLGTTSAGGAKSNTTQYVRPVRRF
jgi:hypothetical protein